MKSEAFNILARKVTTTIGIPLVRSSVKGSISLKNGQNLKLFFFFAFLNSSNVYA